MPLSPEPARPMTSREIAKLLSTILGGLAEYCDPTEICSAMAHLNEHADVYRSAWVQIHELARRS